MKYLWIALGGAAGSIARYWVSVMVYQRFGTRFPYGTFLVNISGCFLIGLLITFLDARTQISSAWRFLLPIGFIGAYTTFSTFEFETVRAAAQGQAATAVLNILLSVAIGYLAVYVGILLGKVIA